MRRLYLDDNRNPLSELDFDVVRSYDEFVAYILKKGVPELISFDHDLADEHVKDYLKDPNNGKLSYESYRERTGYDAAKWLVDYCISSNIKLPKCFVHSQNTIGAMNIRMYINNYLGRHGMEANCKQFWWPLEPAKK